MTTPSINTPHIDEPCVIIDNGSGLIKCGMAGKNEPVIVRSVVGRARVPKIIMGGEESLEIYVGSEIDKFRGILSLDYPIQHGIVTNWDDMERIWSHVYYKTLKITPEDYPVLVTEAPINPRTHRNRLAEVYFENFGVPALHIGTQAVLSLYSAGRVSGLVVDSGDGVTHVVPIYEGYVLPHAIMKMDLAGHTLTKYMFRLLKISGYPFASTADFEIAREIKESVCYVAQNYEEELKTFNEGNGKSFAKKHVLPDGTDISIDALQFMCPEALFNPNHLGIDAQGIHQMVNTSIMECDIDVRKKLYTNIVLSGGTTMFPGLKERLQTEVAALRKSKMFTPIVEAPKERKYLVWLGASILSMLPQFTKELCVSKAEYLEKGSNALSKFF